ncbi:hypothetical protein DICSQDRAFT_151608 [Dichomitus squalens LYAD-421 SS1]|uniref:uncharacterized protein n=1 Tax=Dichomitus squalens (strain LYAD-421) TaxID=732165 RepID=UPI0004411450|nr:uncharacterized protein DICSQDRAFT_151608 [Dichomitus squalens LYAD-421 SS1]EJF67313.1 hypothetical protein DICSQDRAFT_151608 [Dichomitus squalens LYAD-421 SS1]
MSRTCTTYRMLARECAGRGGLAQLRAHAISLARISTAMPEIHLPPPSEDAMGFVGGDQGVIRLAVIALASASRILHLPSRSTPAGSVSPSRYASARLRVSSGRDLYRRWGGAWYSGAGWTSLEHARVVLILGSQRTGLPHLGVFPSSFPYLGHGLWVLLTSQ